jgi:hypothetical protein
MECDICCIAFDQDRLPKILTRCGHTLCSDCIESIRRSSWTADVQCPHCRTLTKPSDVRTNFALVALLETRVNKPPNAQVTSSETCDRHSSNTVSVFCCSCGKFICRDCYEVSSAIHASHNRVSLEDGIKIVSNELEDVRRQIQGALFSTAVEIQAENERVAQAIQALSDIENQAKEHFNTIVLRFRSEYEQLLQQLSSFQNIVNCNLQQALTKKKALAEVLETFPDSRDIQSLTQFLRRKTMVQSLLRETQDARPPSEAMETFTIDTGASESLKTSYLTLLPTLRILNPSEGRLFDLQVPGARRTSRSSSGNSSAPLHRSTSNDQLRS